MASIVSVPGGFRVTVTRKLLGFRKSKTFPRKGDALKWGRNLETQLDLHGAPEAEPEAQTVAVLIEEYIARHQAIKPIGRSKYASLMQLMRFGVTSLRPSQLTQQVMVQHIEQRHASGAGPATANNDLIWLRTVLKYHGISKYRPAIDAIDEAGIVLKQLGLVGKSESRDRRPTDDELIALSKWFPTTRNPWMLDIMWFAIYSTRRQAEISGLLAADNDGGNMTGIVRGLKNPKGKQINEPFRYTVPAWEIVQRQPVSSNGRIFPRSTDVISKHFTTACKILGIEDLRFHDLRHEAVSRLFEQGLTIPEVALHSLHKQWSTLQRYANLDPANAGKKTKHLMLEDCI